MSICVLRTNQLSKEYGEHSALDRVDLSIHKGSIYGFIGQNGAGKSTLMRIVTGLAFPTSGSIELFGESDAKRIVRARVRIGTTIESPALFPSMSAYENMEVQRLQKGIREKEAIYQTLEIVGLQGTGKKPAGDFSLGMKQRLDLAIALLGQPELLILDEPTNGLDPMSVMGLRELLKKLNRECGMTILISSHILSELHLLATHYGIIHQGKLLEQLTVEELNKKCRQYLHIKVNEPVHAAEVIGRELPAAEIEAMPDGIIRLFRYTEHPGKISSMLAAAGLEIEQFMPMGEHLESYFVRRIGGMGHDQSNSV
ncbi:ATP-binding cassette domain-containing protein [Paenibacillus nasutitermitis]|uniref:Bacitracin ABC transporter ATP-binding protein n=1 Tax=Paenibacillus nasutitermitis TaxID=1652958 RepID=A0A917E0V0_9BACL|nr:ATP-binding cassette domain-containing protein [Paenibacillus nasutitermitis]GGD86883.1 bacitracin ABC transporter ATP-binding protein [Paenibacillus nasutitermitis]